MNNLKNTLEALEQACEGESELIAFTQPEMSSVIEQIKTLPADEQAAIRERLDRITTIIEGKMMIYAEELQSLGAQIKNVANSNAGTSAYRAVAVFPIKNENDNT